MLFLNKLMGLFFNEKAAVINEDDTALAHEIEMVKRKFPRLSVKGFTNFEQLVLKKSSPNLQTFKYCDSQDLVNCLSKVR